MKKNGKNGLLKVNAHLINCNSGDNIFELYNVFAQVRFATSKTKLDISDNKHGIRVASPVAKRLKN